MMNCLGGMLPKVRFSFEIRSKRNLRLWVRSMPPSIRVFSNFSLSRDPGEMLLVLYCGEAEDEVGLADFPALPNMDREEGKVMDLLWKNPFAADPEPDFEDSEASLLGGGGGSVLKTLVLKGIQEYKA